MGSIGEKTCIYHHFYTFLAMAQCNTILYYVTLGRLFLWCLVCPAFWKIQEGQGHKKTLKKKQGGLWCALYKTGKEKGES